MPILQPELLLYIGAGALVGFAVGLTGVGGGSLMTPILLLFGFPPQVAIGTDLLYAGITKSSGMVMHARRGNVDWAIMKRMAAGSIPAALLVTATLWLLASSADDYAPLLTTALGITLIVTALVLLFKRRLQSWGTHHPAGVLGAAQQRAGAWTVAMGILLGVFVTLSSVGAGAIGTAVLLVLYPALAPIRIVGTDLAHAVPLTLIAGLGHLALGHVDPGLLVALLMGSLPAIYIGTHVGQRIPNHIMHPVLVTVLLALGVKYAVF
ncbi:sulfite exporter TauE/SafE family protein [Alcanivorax jadensis]|uniref:sulfite exporter TauE/SafE family protein n=1 Tax=Alcanivorax jadensis TaxID=64988 RepID=UPI0026EEFECF|nr:sulfite exporter TauE/SafE family protein [Alcanivorax jadensis]MCK5887861.1 sulfite exporter TauE/SafE family protein [Alcanivorax sp.]